MTSTTKQGKKKEKMMLMLPITHTHTHILTLCIEMYCMTMRVVAHFLLREEEYEWVGARAGTWGFGATTF